MKTFLSTLFCLLYFVVFTVFAYEQNTQQGKIVSSGPLHKLPQYKSPVITQVESDNTVHIFQRERAWYQVQTQNDLSGWIKMLNVRFIGVSKREGELGVKDIFDSVITRQTKPTTSTGIRGFDETDLKSAIANLQQLELLQSYTIAPMKVKKFASEGKLKRNKLVGKLINELAEITKSK